MSSLSVVVLSYNSLELLKQCVLNLLTLTNSPEIILVDNGSSDGSAEWIKSQTNSQLSSYILDHNLGFAAGCNVGIRQSSGDYVLLLNTDAFLTSDSLNCLIRYLEIHPNVGIVGPQLLYADGMWQRSSGAVPSVRSAILEALGITSLHHLLLAWSWPITRNWWRPHEVGYVDGACMLIRRAVIDEIGLLDESFFFFVEDAEFCHRAREHGWLTHYVPQSRVIHLRGGSSSQKDFQKSALMQLASRKLFIERVYGNKSWKKLTFWGALNYWMRYHLCRVLAKNSAKCEKYQFLNEIYWKEYLTSKAG